METPNPYAMIDPNRPLEYSRELGFSSVPHKGWRKRQNVPRTSNVSIKCVL